MKKFSLIIMVLLIGALLLGLSTPIFAENSQESEIDAEIIDDITINEGDPAGLNFGQFTQPAEEVTLYVNPEDYDTAGGEALADEDIDTSDNDFQHLGGAHAADFDVTSPESASNAEVTLTNLPAAINATSGDATMDLSEWAIYDQEGDQLTEDVSQDQDVTISLSDDEGAFSVGAKLTAAADQALGTYEGTFDVEVAYQ
ncbi:MAG: DUF4402 domain-containing protein [bacterium]